MHLGPISSGGEGVIIEKGRILSQNTKHMKSKEGHIGKNTSL